jgi:hypothetical protein
MTTSTITHQSFARGRVRGLEKVTIGKSFKSERDGNYPLRRLKIRKSRQQLVQLLIQNGLKAPHSRLGKEGVDSRSANAMLVMFLACDNRFREAKLVGEPLPPIALLPPASVEFLVEVGRLDMQLKGIDAYNRTVFLVHPSNLKRVLPVLDYVIVEFIPGGQVSESRTVRRIRNL